jgi:hypothetical protein
LSFFASSAERETPHPDQGSNRVTHDVPLRAELHASLEVHLGG